MQLFFEVITIVVAISSIVIATLSYRYGSGTVSQRFDDNLKLHFANFAESLDMKLDKRFIDYARIDFVNSKIEILDLRINAVDHKCGNIRMIAERNSELIRRLETGDDRSKR